MDRRINKTKKILKNSLVDLMEVKDFRKITVTDLTEKSDINRGTFYLHYADIYDMIEKLEDETIDIINEKVKYHSDSIQQNSYFPLLMDISSYLKNDYRFYKALLGVGGDIGYLHKIKGAMTKTFYIHSSGNFKNIKDKSILEAAASFIISGGIGIFQDWLRDDCRQPADKIIMGLDTLFINK